jgi:hypothetical protein
MLYSTIFKVNSIHTDLCERYPYYINQLRHIILFIYLFIYLLVLGLELGVFILSHAISPIFLKGFSR